MTGERPQGGGGGREVDALVVGAGLGGLTAAYELTRAGLRPLVVEARGYVGGLIARAEVAGLTLDIGAEAWAVRRPEVGELVTELGLRVESPAGASWVHSADHRAVRIPARSMLGVPQDPSDPDVVAAIGAEGARRAARDLAEPMSAQGARRLGEGDLGTLVRERMGEAVLERLVGPIAGGIHGADPAKLSAAAVIRGLPGALDEERTLAGAIGLLRSRGPQGPAVASVAGTMADLPRALAHAVCAAGGEIEVRAGARSLRRGDGTWEVVVTPTRPAPSPSDEPVPDGAEAIVRAPRVVLAAGADVAARLLEGAMAKGTAGRVGAVGTVAPLPRVELAPGAPITHVTLVVENADLDAAPRGSGLLVAAGAAEGSREDGAVAAKALTHLTAKWPSLGVAARELGPNVHALRLSYGRAGEPTPHPTVADALADASRLLGVELDESMVRGHKLVRWGGALAPATPQARRSAQELDARAREDAALQGVALTGAWIAGTGLAAIVPHARENARRIAG